MARAVSLYREAIDKCPDDAQAWAGLAFAHMLQANYGYADQDESHRSAREAAERALALDDRLAQAHEVMGIILGTMEFRLKEGMEEVRKARSLAPGATGSMVSLSTFEGVFGRIEEALQLARRANESDPLDPIVLENRARFEGLSSNLEAACEAHLTALELSPGMTAVHSSLGLIYVQRGMGEVGIAEIQREAAAGYRECALAIAYHTLGRRQESDAALARLLTEREQWGFQFAMAYASRGETDEAFRWLERSYELRDSGVVFTKMNPYLRGLHSDSRWPRFLKKIGLED
jgi:tetratricopeptide (TPR) repeat protein